MIVVIPETITKRHRTLQASVYAVSRPMRASAEKSFKPQKMLTAC
jgi:hypothetical protein